MPTLLLALLKRTGRSCYPARRMQARGFRPCLRLLKKGRCPCFPVLRVGIEDVEHVEGLGVNVYKLFTITFILAGVLSGLAGGLHSSLIMVDPQMGIEVLAFVFMVVIIGGLGSIKGTLASAFIVGQVVSLGSLVYAPLAQMAPFAIMLLILLIKPTGLYGSKLLKR